MHPNPFFKDLEEVKHCIEREDPSVSSPTAAVPASWPPDISTAGNNPEAAIFEGSRTSFIAGEQSSFEVQAPLLSSKSDDEFERSNEQIDIVDKKCCSTIIRAGANAHAALSTYFDVFLSGQMDRFECTSSTTAMDFEDVEIVDSKQIWC
jgi:hypothetical protein